MDEVGVKEYVRILRPFLISAVGCGCTYEYNTLYCMHISLDLLSLWKIKELTHYPICRSHTPSLSLYGAYLTDALKAYNCQNT